jgi:peptidoglycan/xylan/chitin deacetylase (PgdA/CDA1 family)
LDSREASLTGTFALTFDTELIWGSFDSTTPAEFERLYPDIRGTIDRILRLLERHDVSATWAVVGHLFLAACSRDQAGLVHPEIAVRPRQRWWPADWYASDPGTDRTRDPLWYGDDIIDALLAARTPQEIGCHSFSHALYGDPDLEREAADADLAACIEQAVRRGITLRSFVFPRNSEGHHRALRDHGFIAFRGSGPAWHGRVPPPFRRMAHFVGQVAGIAPPVSMPIETLSGLWNIPGSMLLIHRKGLRRTIPMKSRVLAATAGIQRAAATGGVFHLWTHPFNVANDPAFMLATLDTILQNATAARDRGTIAIETMGAIAARMARSERLP